MSKRATVTHVIGVFGLSESAVAQRIAETLMSDNPTVDTASEDGEVSVTITATAADEEQAEALCASMMESINERLGAFVYGTDVPNLQRRVVSLLQEKHMKIATAESCTAGILSGRLTEIPGASEVFECGVAAYSNDIKHSVLGVPSDLLELYGAVSPEVASAMAVGIHRISGADFGISITGVAGPDMSEGKPTGTVYIALADDKRVWIKKLEETGADRDEVRAIATTHALDLARRYLEALPAIMAGAQLLERPSSEKQSMPVAQSNRHSILDHLLLSRAHGKAAVFRCLAIWFLILLLIAAVVMLSFGMYPKPSGPIYDDLSYEPSTASDVSMEKGVYPEGMQMRFYALFAHNSDIRGWIIVEDPGKTPLLDIQVMDYKSNFYADHDWDQNDSAKGVPYFDEKCDLSSPEADNRVLTVYGNGGEDGQPFAPLRQYSELAFLEAHPYLTLNTIYEDARWQVWAVMVVSAADNNADFDYTQTQFESDKAFTAFVDEIKARSLFETSVTPTAEDHLLMLSVDSHDRDIPEERLVIVARKLAPDASASTVSSKSAASTTTATATTIPATTEEITLPTTVPTEDHSSEPSDGGDA